MGISTSTPSQLSAEPTSPGDANGRLALVTTAHGITHMQQSLLPLIYPMLMQTMGFGYAELGLMLTITRLVGGLLQGIWGPISRRVPGSVLIGLESIGVGLGMGLVGYSQNLAELTGTVAFGQVAASPQHPIASSMLSRWFGKARRGHALSVHFAGGNVATVLSPLLGTFLLARYGWKITLEIFTLPGILVGILVLLRLPREIVADPAPAKEKRWAGHHMWTALKDRRVLRLLLTASVTAGGKGIGILQTFIPLLLIQGMHLSTVKSGVLFSVFTVTGVVGPLIAGRMSDRYDRPKFLSVLLLMSCGASVLTGLMVHGAFWIIIPLLMVMGLLAYAYSPVEQAIMGDLADQALQADAYSLFYSVSFALSSAWPLILGIVLSRFGFGTMFMVIAVSYLVGAIIYGTQDWTAAKTPAV